MAAMAMMAALGSGAEDEAGLTLGQIPAAMVQERLASAPRVHPRLLANDADFAALRERVAAGGLAAELAAEILRQADALLTQPPVTRKMEGRRLLAQSRTCLARVLTLAMAWRLNGRPEHLRRCQEEMLAAAAFSDWNPSHFLDVGEMTFALAVGYDWLYHELDADARTRIRDGIVSKGLRTSQEHEGWWVRATNNWGQVCHGGLVAGGLAILEDEPELAAAIVLRAVNNVHLSMHAYAPRGSYPEGPMYWSYGTTYNVLLIAMLEQATGSDFLLGTAPGFSLTGEYLSLVTGPSGRTFNYADGGDSRSHEPINHWFAERYGRPDWAAPEVALLRRRLATANARQGDRFAPLTLLWLRELPTDPPVQSPLHWASGGDVPVSVHRSGWKDREAIFVGLKAGAATANHGHMDAGSFVLDADGVRWGLDLGAEPYHAIEARGMKLWDRGQDSDRWRLFRLNNLSHNTLTINGHLHVAKGMARLVSFSAEGSFPHSVVDLGEVYAGQAEAVYRGVALLPSGQVLIRDSLRGLIPGDRVRWGMVTRATMAGTTGAVVELTQDKQSLQLRLLAPADIVWNEVDTAQPRADWDSPNPGTRMVAFEAIAPADGKIELAVLFTPGSRTAAALDEVDLRPPQEWAKLPKP